jgi:hypothetical protein
MKFILSFVLYEVHSLFFHLCCMNCIKFILYTVIILSYLPTYVLYEVHSLFFQFIKALLVEIRISQVSVHEHSNATGLWPTNFRMLHTISINEMHKYVHS